MKTTANKISRVLGIAFLLQFITSFSSGSFIKPLWFVEDDIQATMLKIAEFPFAFFIPYVPFELVMGIWILNKGIPEARQVT